MKVKCHTLLAAPGLATEYLPVLRQFGSNDEIRRWAEAYVQVHAGRLQWDVEFLTRNYHFTSCLNIGGAPFLFEYLMTKQPNLSLISLDLDPGRFPLVTSILNIGVAQIDIEQVRPEAISNLGQFECVVFCEIFEHLRIDVLRTMDRIAKLMTPEGLLYLTMPNGLGVTAWLTKFAQGRTGPEPVPEWRKLSELGHMGHVREYSFRELQEVLRECGLFVERYMFRRQSCFYGTMRSKMRDLAYRATTTLVPSLGDELVVIARKRS